MSIKSKGYNIDKSVVQGRYTTAGNSFSDIRIDSATDTLQTITYEHHEIHSGSHYFISNVATLSINNVLDITFLTPNTTKWIHWTWKLDTETETAWYIYEDATATTALANTITPFNNDRNSLNTSGATVKYEVQGNLAAADADTDVTGATLIESGISGSGKTMGDDNRDNEIILAQNTLYCLRGVATAAGFVDFHMGWYEYTNIR